MTNTTSLPPAATFTAVGERAFDLLAFGAARFRAHGVDVRLENVVRTGWLRPRWVGDIVVRGSTEEHAERVLITLAEVLADAGYLRP